LAVLHAAISAAAPIAPPRGNNMKSVRSPVQVTEAIDKLSVRKAAEDAPRAQ
jgi:hypothetical protein